jgi:hypothetical protein
MPLRNMSPKTAIDVDGRNRTGTHLSTNIIIAVQGKAIAAIKSLSVDENRSIAEISEVGTDGIIDSAPQKSTSYGIQCERTRFDGTRISEAFYNGFLHVKSQRIPFDIEIYDFIQGDANNQVITVIKNCWIQKIGYNYNSENFVITENMSLTAEDIYSIRNGESAVNDKTLIVNPFSATADVGKYRGALDGAGLINAFDGDNGNTL